MQYDIVISTLSEEDGGGFVGYVPDLDGCMSDGESPKEAFDNTMAAMADWLEAYSKSGRELPEPGLASKRAIEDRNRLVSVIKILSEGIDGRLDELESQIREIAESLEHADDWNRFSRLTGMPKTALLGVLPTNQADELV